MEGPLGVPGGFSGHIQTILSMPVLNVVFYHLGKILNLVYFLVQSNFFILVKIGIFVLLCGKNTPILKL